jgi:hypothetical protein
MSRVLIYGIWSLRFDYNIAYNFKVFFKLYSFEYGHMALDLVLFHGEWVAWWIEVRRHPPQH